MVTINLRTQCYLIRINIQILHTQFSMHSKNCIYTQTKSLTVTTPPTAATIKDRPEKVRRHLPNRGGAHDTSVSHSPRSVYSHLTLQSLQY